MATFLTPSNKKKPLRWVKRKRKSTCIYGNGSSQATGGSCTNLGHSFQFIVMVNNIGNWMDGSNQRRTRNMKRIAGNDRDPRIYSKLRE
jgi:hypothetical protein